MLVKFRSKVRVNGKGTGKVRVNGRVEVQLGLMEGYW